MSIIVRIWQVRKGSLQDEGSEGKKEKAQAYGL